MTMHATLRCFTHSVYTAVTKCHQHSGPSPSFFQGSLQSRYRQSEQPVSGSLQSMTRFMQNNPSALTGSLQSVTRFMQNRAFCFNGFFAQYGPFYAEQPFSFSNGFFALCGQLLRTVFPCCPDYNPNKLT